MKISPAIIHAGNLAFSKTVLPYSDPETWHIRVKKLLLEAQSQNLQSGSPMSEKVLAILSESFELNSHLLTTEIGNLELKNPVGLGAGILKEPYGLKFIEALGAGFITVGSISPKQQIGNEPKRIFAYGGDVTNAMGLPSDGVDEVLRMFEYLTMNGLMPRIPVTANLCNADNTTTEDEKIEQFLEMIEKLYPYVDTFEINISCPNQHNGTEMQKGNFLESLMQKVNKLNEKLANGGEKKNIFLKIGPVSKNLENDQDIKDLTSEAIEAIAETVNKNKHCITGITATNTASEHDYPSQIWTRDGTRDMKGGLSGGSLYPESLATVKLLSKYLDDDVSINGGGGLGFGNNKRGIEMMDSGADTIFMVTSLVRHSIADIHYQKQAILKNRIEK